MSDDIVTRLRRVTEVKMYNELTDELEVVATFTKSDDSLEAADEIERLRKWAEYEHAGYCGCAGGDPECVQRAYTTWRKMFDD